MKRKLMVGGIVGAVIVGGGFGVSAMTNNNDDGWSSQKAKVTLEEAKSIAKEEVQGLSIDKVERDTDDGRKVYDIDGTTEKGKEVELDIAADTGEVVKQDRDDDDENDDDNNKNTALKVSKEKAKEIAKNEVDGEVTEIEVDDDHYEVELHDGKNEYELKINGQSGEIISSEKDQDDD